MELFSVYTFAKNSATTLADFMIKITKQIPVILCLGTDKILADCLGALVGNTLKNENYPNYIYGCLDAPITHKNAQFCHDFIHEMHPLSPLLIIDSMATNSQSRLGQISIQNNYIGAVNNLNLRADIFLYGITSLVTNHRVTSARLQYINQLNKTIVSAIKMFIKNIQTIHDNSILQKNF